MLDSTGVAVYPWAHGEILTAAALNEAIAQSGGTAISTTPPGSPGPGTSWFNPTTGMMSVWDGSAWQPLSYLPLTGGPLTGPLTLAADPAAALQPVTLQYFSAHAVTGGPFLPLSGGAMTGNLDAPVLAAGSNTARMLTARFADPINVRDYGADNTGGADATAAIQAALNAIPAWSGGSVYFPPGKYQITGTLTIPTAALSGNDLGLGVRIFGAGRGLSQIITNMTTSSFMTCIVTGVAWNLAIEDLTFIPYQATFNAWHILIQNVGSFTLRRCVLESQNNTPGAVAGCRVYGTTGGIFYTRVEGCTLAGCTLELDGLTDNWITGSVLQCITSGAGGARPSSVHLMSTSGAAVGDTKILGNHIYSGTSGAIWCSAANSSIVLVENNMFDTNPPNPTTAIAINVQATGHLWNITGNIFNAIPANAVVGYDLSSSTINNNVFISCGGANGAGAYTTISLNQTSTGSQYNVIADNVARYDGTLTSPNYFVSENGAGTGHNTYSGNTAVGTGYQANPYQVNYASAVRLDGSVVNLPGTLAVNGQTDFWGSVGFHQPVTHSATVTMSGARLFFGSQVGASQTDLTKHIDLYAGTFGFCIGPAYDMNIVTQTGYPLRFKCDGGDQGYINSTGLNSCPIGQQNPTLGAFTAVEVGSAAGPNIRSGTGAATGTQPSGSVWLRTDGTVGNRLYVTAGGGTWAAVAGV